MKLTNIKDRLKKGLDYNHMSWGSELQQFYEEIQIKLLITENKILEKLHKGLTQEDMKKEIEEELRLQNIINILWKLPDIKKWVYKNLWQPNH